MDMHDKIRGDEEVLEALDLFAHDMKDFAESLAEDYGDREQGRLKLPWGDTDYARDIVLWGLGFYFDPHRQLEMDQWDLMENTEQGPIHIVSLLHDMDLTTDRMVDDPNLPAGTVSRELVNPGKVWEVLKELTQEVELP